MNREERIMKRVQEHYDYLQQKEYEIVFLALQGSQNYELDVYDENYMSDVDTKAVVLPSFEDFVYNRQPVSETVVLENNEHIDVKDVRVMFETYKKQNVNYIETLFSKFRIVNDKYKNIVQILFDNAEEIAHINFNQALRCMAGMSKEKLKALTHPYPTIVDKIEKYGYDPKQLHHICRMNDFIKKYANGMPYEDCLIPDDKEKLIDIKKGILGVEEAEKLAVLLDKDTYNVKEENVTEIDIINQKGIYILNKVKFDLLRKKYIEDLYISTEIENLEETIKRLKMEYKDTIKFTVVYNDNYYTIDTQIKNKLKETKYYYLANDYKNPTKVKFIDYYFTGEPSKTILASVYNCSNGEIEYYKPKKLFKSIKAAEDFYFKNKYKQGVN